MVFLGPTLPESEARAVLPDAIYLPPARCGDVLGALRLAPRVLLVIDGSYERTPAVWHKELAVALERGVRVVGAASMGALRAAELSSYGMVGVGGIFEDFREGRLVDDDEVAVVHSSSGQPLSTAMVDIRATLESAVESGVLSASVAARALAFAKDTFYPERSFARLLDGLGGEPEASRLARWLAHGGLVQRKRDDALLALRTVAGRDFGEAPRPALVQVPRTSFLRVLVRHVACSALLGQSAQLPKSERVVQAARFLGEPYRDAKRLAELMAALHEIAPAEAGPESDGWWLPEMREDRWAEVNELSPDERAALVTRVRQLARLQHALLRVPAEAQARLAFRARTQESRYLRWLDALDDVRRGPGSEPGRVRTLLARAWRLLDEAGRRAGLVPRTELLDSFFGELRRQHGLSSGEQVEGWLTAHRLGRHELAALLIARLRWHAIASQAQPAALGQQRSSDDVFWLLDALRCSGLYARARELLETSPEARARSAELPEHLGQALERDFDTDDRATLLRRLTTL